MEKNPVPLDFTQINKLKPFKIIKLKRNEQEKSIPEELSEISTETGYFTSFIDSYFFKNKLNQKIPFENFFKTFATKINKNKKNS